MTLWHKSTESAKGSGLVVIKNGKNIGIMTAYEHRSQAPASRWCYLTELLKLKQENKKLQEKLEIAVKVIKTVIREEADNIDGGMLMFLTEALAKIKENN